MVRGRDVAKSISDAIEASYYVAPKAPGLMTDELAAVLGEFGYKSGEINDAVRTTLASQLGRTASGLVFTLEGLPVWLTEPTPPFADDPRDWDVFGFVHEKLQERAREKGLANAKFSISEIYIEGESHGFDLHQLELAVFGLPLMKLARLDAATNAILLTDQGSRWTLLGSRRDQSNLAHPRPEFQRMLEGVKRVRERRDPAVRWRELRAELAGVEGHDEQTSDEMRVIDDLCARFADDGSPVSLDDAVRRLPDLDVRLLVNGKLEQNQLVHVRPDTRVVPSLLALRRHLDLFGPLFLLCNEVLHRAKDLWDRKELELATHGPHGLIKASKPGPPPLEVRQLDALIECMSMRPAVLPSAQGRVEIRDEVRFTDTAARLIEFQRRNYLRRPPQVVLLPPSPITASPASPGATPAAARQTMTKPRMFIGSTVEALPIARAVQSELNHEMEITLWNQSFFTPGTPTWTDLVKRAQQGDFEVALLVLGGEDEVTSRGTTSRAPRDNVLLEFGLFTGALGADRTFFLVNHDHKPKIATDLAGITPLTYGDRSDGNNHAAVGAACSGLRLAVRRLAEVATGPKR